MLFAKQFLQIIFENLNLEKFVSRKKLNQSTQKNRNRNDEKFDNKNKDKTYVINKIDEEYINLDIMNSAKEFQNYHDQKKNYYIDENVKN